MQNEHEKNWKHGAIPTNRIHRWVHKKVNRRPTVKAIGFDWTKKSRSSQYGLRDLITIKNQGSNFSCGGQSGAYLLFIVRYLLYYLGIIKDVTEVSKELSAKSIYAPIAFSSGGTIIPYLVKQIGYMGANLERLVPSYDLYGNPLPEYLMKDLSWRTPETIQDAYTRSGFYPVDIPDDIDSVASAIDQYGAVIWEIHAKNNGTWQTARPQPMAQNNQNEMWAHFMCAFDWQLNNGKKEIVAIQSEGKNWGDGGFQYFGEEFFDGKNIVDAFSFLYDGYLQPNNDNQSIWANIVRWFRSQPWYWKLKF